MTEQLRGMIIRHEGRVVKGGRHMPYICPAGKQTIAYGRNIEDRGLSEAEAQFLLDNDIADTTNEVRAAFPRVDWLDDVRRAVVVSMVFNMGLPRFRGFKRMIAAIERGDYKAAADEMMDSRWANQVGARARELAQMMCTGEWI